jgi:subtilisin family serine protease
LKNNLNALVAGSLVLAALAGCGVQATAPSMGSTEARGIEASKAVLAKRLVVGFAKMPSAAELSAIEKANGVTLVKSLKKVAMGVFETKADLNKAAKALKATKGVEFVELELLPEQEPVKFQSVKTPIRQGGGDPNRSQQYYLDLMGIPAVWDSGKVTKTITVAVVDTGCDLKHPDLQGSLVPGYNVADPSKPPQDDAGHGTMTAGLVGAVANNGMGIAGVAPNAKIMPVKVGNSASSIVEAMMYAADHADMITMSLSIKPNMSEYGTAVETTKRAAEYVMSKGKPMVCSMGNTSSSSKNVPSYFAGNSVPGLIAVGATDAKDKVTSFSTYGNWTSVSAPGARIMTTTNGGGYGLTDGTSFSTPITAGVVALMLGAGHSTDPAAVKATLQKTSVDIEAPGYDDKAGSGRVNAAAAVLGQ